MYGAPGVERGTLFVPATGGWCGLLSFRTEFRSRQKALYFLRREGTRGVVSTHRSQGGMWPPGVPGIREGGAQTGTGSLHTPLPRVCSELCKGLQEWHPQSSPSGGGGAGLPMSHMVKTSGHAWVSPRLLQTSPLGNTVLT